MVCRSSMLFKFIAHGKLESFDELLDVLVGAITLTLTLRAAPGPVYGERHTVIRFGCGDLVVECG